MWNLLKKLLWKPQHTHDWTLPLKVSGYGYTEYEIRFCKNSNCLKGEIILTKQLW